MSNTLLNQAKTTHPLKNKGKIMTSAKALAKELAPQTEKEELVKEYQELNDKVDLVLLKITNRKRSRKTKTSKTK